MNILARVKASLLPTESAEEAFLLEKIKVASDRICLRIGEEHLPEKLESIAVEVSLKLIRRRYFEGVGSETMKNEVRVDLEKNILAEYEGELQAYCKARDAQKISDENRKVARFI